MLRYWSTLLSVPRICMSFLSSTVTSLSMSVLKKLFSPRVSTSSRSLCKKDLSRPSRSSPGELSGSGRVFLLFVHLFSGVLRRASALVPLRLQSQVLSESCSGKSPPRHREPLHPIVRRLHGKPPKRATVVPENRVSAGGDSIRAEHRAQVRLERMLVIAASTEISPVWTTPASQIAPPVSRPSPDEILCSVSLMPHTRHSFPAYSPSKPLSCAFPSRDGPVALATLPASPYPLALHATPRRVSLRAAPELCPARFPPRERLKSLTYLKNSILSLLLVCEMPEGDLVVVWGGFVIRRPRISSAGTNAAPLPS